MAVAYFPQRIRAFPTHQDLLDDVRASHVNNLQSELEAVMRSLGTMPHVYNNIQTDGPDSVATPGDLGSVEDDDTLFQSIYRFYDPKVKPIDHGNVGQRMDDIERGTQHHVFALRAYSLDIASGNSNIKDRPKGVRFPKPASDKDPFEMHDGVGVLLRKSGFWIFDANLAFSLQGTTANSNNGMYQATIDHDGNFVDGLVRSRESGLHDFPFLRPGLMGFFSRGTRITLRASQNSGRNQKIRMARLSGVLIREVIDD